MRGLVEQGKRGGRRKRRRKKKKSWVTDGTGLKRVKGRRMSAGNWPLTGRTSEMQNTGGKKGKNTPGTGFDRGVLSKRKIRTTLSKINREGKGTGIQLG